ncbi:MAG: tyrosine-type recombinase/integrase [Rhodothermales bacterium]|nr:tyrosine-type recombinase/integrase [Rhodothermales bacterium]MBO6781599.1 tyrosine-type recombinase/integrase [Rhodothermales bacterium]
MSDKLVPVYSERDQMRLARSTGSDQDLINLWLRGKSPRTAEAYRRDTNQFLKFFGGSLHYVKLDDLWEWNDELTARDLSVSSIARKMATLKSLFSFGHRIGVLTVNVGAAFNLPKVPSHLSERILTEEETRLLLNDPDSTRNTALLRLFYASGARVSELVALTWTSVRPRKSSNGRATAQITLLGKGSKVRTVLLPASVWDVVARYWESEQAGGFGRPDDPVFRSIRGGALSRQQMWRIVRSAARRAGLPQKVSPHWLRHAHASHALDRGAPVHLVKETLGHESLATTSKYTHARPDDSSANYLDV